MRFLVTTGAALLAAGCATNEDNRFQVGRSGDALVVIGVAEAFNQRDPAYSMLWRRVDAGGRFMEFDGPNAFEVVTNDDDTLRVSGLPGEFAFERVEPGVYALDSVFAVIRENQVNYVSNGVLAAPDRPSFSVAAGEAVYLGIWQMDLEGADAVARPWRLDPADLRAISRGSNDVSGPIELRETETRAVACEPRRLNNRTQREIC